MPTLKGSETTRAPAAAARAAVASVEPSSITSTSKLSACSRISPTVCAMDPASLNAGTIARCRLMRAGATSGDRGDTLHALPAASNRLFARGELLLEQDEGGHRGGVGAGQRGEIHGDEVAQQHERADPLQRALPARLNHAGERRVRADQPFGQLDPRAQTRVAVAVAQEDRAERTGGSGARPARDLVVVEFGE